MKMDVWEYSSWRNLVDILVKLRIPCHIEHFSISISKQYQPIEMGGMVVALGALQEKYEVTLRD